MIAVVDACTILNLLQSVFEERYIVYLQRIFETVVIHQKVFEEINKNKYNNLPDIDREENLELRHTLDVLIHSHIKQFITYEDIEECWNFVKTITNHPQEKWYDGEVYSIALSLYWSRLGKVDTNENLLRVCFLSDDAVAIKKDFGDFVRINQLGQCLDSIDIITLCYLKEFIPKKEVLDYCISLKALLNEQMYPLIKEIESIKRGKDRSTQHTLSTLSDYIKNNDIPKLRELEREPPVVKIKRTEKRFTQLFGDFLESNIGVKIQYIEDRRKAIECDHVWKI